MNIDCKCVYDCKCVPTYRCCIFLNQNINYCQQMQTQNPGGEGGEGGGGGKNATDADSFAFVAKFKT